MANNGDNLHGSQVSNKTPSFFFHTSLFTMSMSANPKSVVRKDTLKSLVGNVQLEGIHGYQEPTLLLLGISQVFRYLHYVAYLFGYVIFMFYTLIDSAAVALNQ